jgi:osmoprotectant transport system ATP-binding protein
MIQLENVSKSFHDKVVLRNISVDLSSMQTHVLLGESGSGKSTILKIIMGLVWPDAGRVVINGEVMQSHAQQHLAQKIGYVLQDGGLFPHLTVESNVSLIARTSNWSFDKVQSRIHELLSLVNLQPSILKQWPRQLSGGEKQRVAVMRAAFLDPPVILLDEPLGALDPLIRSSLQVELKNIFNKLNKLVVMVTHDIAEAAFFGHTITLLRHGVVLQHGSFKDLLNQPRHPYVKEFIQAQRTLHSLDHWS